MLLGKNKIQEAISEGEISISEIGKDTFQPASIDLTIGDGFLIPHSLQSPKRIGEAFFQKVFSGTMILNPLNFVLCRSKEVIKLSSRYAGFVQGRSGVGRSGLNIQNAGFIDPGFEGSITLELFNMAPYPIEIHVGERIAQIVILEANGAVPYHGSYQGQLDATASLYRIG